MSTDDDRPWHEARGDQQTGYSVERDKYYAARKRLGDRFWENEEPAELLEWLTREPMNLRNRVGLTVLWGLRSKLVHYNPASGLAYADQAFEDVDP